MNRSRIHSGAAAALALAGVLAATAAHAQERYTITGERVAVYNLAGAVRVEPGSGSAVAVVVTRGGGDARQLDVRQGEGGGYRHLAVVYPDARIVYPALGRGSSTTLQVRDDGTFGGDRGMRLLGGGHEVRISGAGSGVQAWADLSVQVPAGRTVAIHQGAGTIEVTNVSGELHLKGYAASIRTAGTRGSLDLDTGSGAVEVRGAQGDVKIDTGSGRVRTDDVSGGVLNVDTGSGGVSGEGIRVQRLHVDVGSGRVDLGGVEAQDVNVDTGSGAVALRMRGDSETMRIDTGSVLLAVPAHFGAQADIDTGSGGIRVEVPAEVTRSTRSHFTGRLGDGRGRLVIDTGSGGVQLVRN
jgi:hypothetical protein